MARRPPEPIDVEYREREVGDASLPPDGAVSQLERSLGPSCLLSLVIVFLLLIVLRRFVNFGWIGTGILAVVVWYGVFVLLVRWRPGRLDDGD